jgi:hypothetical protein
VMMGTNEKNSKHCVRDCVFVVGPDHTMRLAIAIAAAS